jgi:hypothetical protein
MIDLQSVYLESDTVFHNEQLLRLPICQRSRLPTTYYNTHSHFPSAHDLRSCDIYSFTVCSRIPSPAICFITKHERRANHPLISRFIATIE